MSAAAGDVAQLIAATGTVDGLWLGCHEDSLVMKIAWRTSGARKALPGMRAIEHRRCRPMAGEEPRSINVVTDVKAYGQQPGRFLPR